MEQGAKEKGLLQTLRGIKRIEWIAVLLIAGAAILLIATFQPQVPEDQPAVPAGASRASSDLESRMEATLSLIEGAGRVRVLVNRKEAREATEPASGDSAAEITGVIVVSDGADDLAVRLDLARAVQSLLGVPQSNIEIFAMAKESEENP